MTERKTAHAKWRNNNIHVIIATIAFGMGINKKDVRFIIHTSMPKTIEHYIQEWGRAGRDGNRSRWIIYYNYSDRRVYDFLINSKNTNMEAKKEMTRNMYKILDIFEEPFHWRREMLLNYLGEHISQEQWNKMWDNWCKVKDRESKTLFIRLSFLSLYLLICILYENTI